MADIYEQFLITQKKHYIGICQDESKEPVIKGMEGIKSDRPTWINKIERQFVNDIKYGKNPTINILTEYKSMEIGQIQLDDLAIKLALQKDPSDYGENSR